MRAIGVNTWVWTSPLTDATLPALARRIADLGFDAIELPLENAGDLTVAAVRAVLDDTGLAPYVVGAMAPGRNLVAAPAAEVGATQDYLRACVDLAAGIGAPQRLRPVLRRDRPGLADGRHRARGRRTPSGATTSHPSSTTRQLPGSRSASSRSTATRRRWSTPSTRR